MTKQCGRTVPGMFVAGLCAVFLSTGISQADEFCGDNSPARPVAECVDSTGDSVACNTPGAIQLWPDNFRPGGMTRGGEVHPPVLPESRDSTQRVAGTTVPGSRSGHELFKSLSIVDDRIYVAYNAGLQVWNLDPDPEDPTMIADRDGWLGHFLTFPPVSEQLTFVEDIAAIDPGPTQNDLIFLSGKEPVGPSIWEWNGTNFVQHYQDEGTTSRQVRVVEVGNVVYGLTATDDGVVVYNLTAASNLSSPCLDDQGTHFCGTNVYRGEIPGMTLGRYLDVIVSSGKLYVATTDGFFRPIQIWELPDPNQPSTAIERFDGSGVGFGARGPAFFEYNNDTYLAFTQNHKIKIYDVDDCLDSNGCSALGACKLSGGACEIPISDWSSSEQYVTYSESNGTPFLYYGGTPLNIEGPRVEKLVDVSQLGAANPSFPAMTDNGGSYTDPCNGLQVDYWGDYYPKNDNGLRNFYPRMGKFRGGYFYRVAQTLFDVHVREDVVIEPRVTVTALTAPDENTGVYWFDEPITFSAAAQNCTPSSTWVWDQSSSSTVGGINASTNVATLTWNCGESLPSYCDDENVSVMAVPVTGCGLSPDQVQIPNPLVLKDPRARIDAINTAPAGGSYPAGTELSFSADVQGKTPFTYTWSVVNNAQQEVASGAGSTFQWANTCDAINVPELIFADSFETGDTLSWDPFDDYMTARYTAPTPKALGAETFEVKLTLENSASVTDSVMVTLVPPGVVGFSSPPLTVEDLGGGTFRLTANTSNATEWRWEIEDPDGEDVAACGVYARCQLHGWGEEDHEVVYSWQQEGTYNVKIWARNSCTPEVQRQADGAVDVTEVIIEPLEVTSFNVDPSDTDCTQSLGFVDCLVNRTISFDVSFTGNPTVLEVDWENNGNFVSESVPGNGVLTHVYSSTQSSFKPQIRAVKGAEVSSVRLLGATLTIKTSL